MITVKRRKYEAKEMGKRKKIAKSETERDQNRRSRGGGEG